MLTSSSLKELFIQTFEGFCLGRIFCITWGKFRKYIQKAFLMLSLFEEVLSKKRGYFSEALDLFLKQN